MIIKKIPLVLLHGDLRLQAEHIVENIAYPKFITNMTKLTEYFKGVRIIHHPYRSGMPVQITIKTTIKNRTTMN